MQARTVKIETWAGGATFMTAQRVHTLENTIQVHHWKILTSQITGFFQKVYLPCKNVVNQGDLTSPIIEWKTSKRAVVWTILRTGEHSSQMLFILNNHSINKHTSKK